MSAADYLNKKFDILAFRGGTDTGDVQLAQSLFDATIGGEVCTGMQKLAQQWLLEFLTIRGSMGYHLVTRGSDFLAYLRQGRIRTEFDVQAYFDFAAEQVAINLRNDLTETAPADERLKSAFLDNISLISGSLELQVTLTSDAETTREVILPLPYTPINMTL